MYSHIVCADIDVSIISRNTETGNSLGREKGDLESGVGGKFPLHCILVLLFELFLTLRLYYLLKTTATRINTV